MKFKSLVFVLIASFFMSSCSVSNSSTFTKESEEQFCTKNNDSNIKLGLNDVECKIMKEAAQEVCTGINEYGLDEYFDDFSAALNSKEGISDSDIIAASYLLVTSVTTYCPQHYEKLVIKAGSKLI
jgi:hypothetical protein